MAAEPKPARSAGATPIRAGRRQTDPVVSLRDYLEVQINGVNDQLEHFRDDLGDLRDQNATEHGAVQAQIGEVRKEIAGVRDQLWKVVLAAGGLSGLGTVIGAVLLIIHPG